MQTENDLETHFLGDYTFALCSAIASEDATLSIYLLLTYASELNQNLIRFCVLFSGTPGIAVAFLFISSVFFCIE
jgi:hypothetical protein